MILLSITDFCKTQLVAFGAGLALSASLLFVGKKCKEYTDAKNAGVVA